MNYKEYQEFRAKGLSQYQDFGKTNLYAEIPGVPLENNAIGHVNGKVHRCHLAEDFCRIHQIPYQTRENMIISYGVRDMLKEMMIAFSDKQWLIPLDVYPWYQQEADRNHLAFKEYETIEAELFYSSADILLICIPLKPFNKIFTKSDIDKIIQWKQENTERRVIVDCAYCLEYSELFDYMRDNDFTLLFSLSKLFSHPNIMGLGLLSSDMMIMRSIFAQRKMDAIKMNQAYNLLNHHSGYIQQMKNNIKEKQKKLISFNITPETNDYSYLFWSNETFDYFLGKNILTIPASVYNSNRKGVIISVLS